MWLLRGLNFTARGLRINLQNPTEELSASFTKGYEQSLKKYHSFAVKPVFYVSWCGWGMDGERGEGGERRVER